ncbi:hypothetical protein EJD97_019585, partial [Solanum chilense]
MNTRRNAGMRFGEAAARGSQAPPHAPATKVQVSVNPVALTDGEVRAIVVQIDQVITSQEHAITAQATREGSPRKNPHASTMASRLRDFTRRNPPVYFESRTN